MDDKIENLCRTCCTKDSYLFSVFDVYDHNLTLDCIIQDVTGIAITADENYLPTGICEKCKEKAICAYEFRKSTINCDEELRKFVETKNHVEEFCNKDSYEVKTEAQHSYNTFLDVTFDSPSCLNDDLDDVKLEGPESSVFQCNKCEIILGSVEDLNDHLLSNICDKGPVNDSDRLCCVVCGQFYDTPELLEKHLQEHNNGYKKKLRSKKTLTERKVDTVVRNGIFEKPLTLTSYKCSFCKQCFVNKVNMKSHLYDHKGTKIVYCNVCKKMYLRREDFDKHACLIEKSAVVENEIITGDLQRNLIYSEILLEDILHNNAFEDSSDIIQVCTVCSCVLLSEGLMANHIDCEHPEQSQTCTQCKKVFASTKTAARHRKNCKQLEKKYSCMTCGEKFAYEISLNKHILRHHEGQSVSVKFMDTKSRLQERQYQCDTCSKSFTRKDLLVKHTKIHMPNEKCFECDVCKKRFHRRDNLRSHKRVHEFQIDKTTASNCLCLYCGRSFSNSSNLIVHMRRHTGEKPYKCDFCGKGFPRSSDLKWHRRSHTGEKPCVCRICNKRFSRSNKLTRHMRVHTGHKPHKCTYCDKAFSQSYDLTLHVRRHTGDKPYICEVCGDRFIQGNALHNHRRVHGHFPVPETVVAGQQPQGVSFAVVHTILQ